MSTTTASTTAADPGGFWSSLGTAVSNTAANVLPIWTAQQLGLSQTSNTMQPTYNPNVAPPKIPQSTPAPAASGGFQLSKGMLIGLAALVAGGFFLILEEDRKK